MIYRAIDLREKDYHIYDYFLDPNLHHNFSKQGYLLFGVKLKYIVLAFSTYKSSRTGTEHRLNLDVISLKFCLKLSFKGLSILFCKKFV
jgi:hypothetical protein